MLREVVVLKGYEKERVLIPLFFPEPYKNQATKQPTIER